MTKETPTIHQDLPDRHLYQQQPEPSSLLDEWFATDPDTGEYLHHPPRHSALAPPPLKPHITDLNQLADRIKSFTDSKLPSSPKKFKRIQTAQLPSLIATNLFVLGYDTGFAHLHQPITPEIQELKNSTSVSSQLSVLINLTAQGFRPADITTALPTATLEQLDPYYHALKQTQSAKNHNRLENIFTSVSNHYLDFCSDRPSLTSDELATLLSTTQGQELLRAKVNQLSQHYAAIYRSSDPLLRSVYRPAKLILANPRTLLNLRGSVELKFYTTPSLVIYTPHRISTFSFRTSSLVPQLNAETRERQELIFYTQAIQQEAALRQAQIQSLAAEQMITKKKFAQHTLHGTYRGNWISLNRKKMEPAPNIEHTHVFEVLTANGISQRHILRFSNKQWQEFYQWAKLFSKMVNIIEPEDRRAASAGLVRHPLPLA